jgi:hypothetical protein
MEGPAGACGACTVVHPFARIKYLRACINTDRIRIFVINLHGGCGVAYAMYMQALRSGQVLWVSEAAHAALKADGQLSATPPVTSMASAEPHSSSLKEPAVSSLATGISRGGMAATTAMKLGQPPHGAAPMPVATNAVSGEQPQLQPEPQPEPRPQLDSMSGWLEREEKKKKWAKLFLKLEEGVLRGYASQTTSTPLLQLGARDCALRLPKSSRKGRPACFRIDTSNTKLMLDPSTDDMRAQWMIALGTAGANVPQEYAQKVRVAREKLAGWERQARAQQAEELRMRRLMEAMRAHGLTEAEQAQLVAEGVTTAEVFDDLTDALIAGSGIDIAARREQKRRNDQREQVQQILRVAGVSAAAASKLHAVSSVLELKELDVVGIPQLSIIDRKQLQDVIRSPAVLRAPLVLTEPEREQQRRQLLDDEMEANLSADLADRESS